MAIASSAQTLTTLASFNGSDGSGPSAALIQGPDGKFYGTTSGGGPNEPNGGGTVFEISSIGEITDLYFFCSQSGCTDGSTPDAGLVLGIDGNFYGTTSLGGANGHYGTIFKITPSGNLTTLYSFCGQALCTDGGYSTGGLIQGPDENFYGTAFAGGIGDAQWCSGGCGTVFKITPQGTYTVLHSFAGYNTEGAGPSAGLVLGRDGNFYGTTTNGGAHNECPLGCGTVFKITPKGTLTTLYSFCAQQGCTDGSAPYAGLTFARDGNFYGTTSNGGTKGAGTAFKITPAGMLTTMYNFCSQTNCSDGQMPEGGLLQATDGNVYGTVPIGGAYTAGSIFTIGSTGVLTTLYSFCSNGYPDCLDGSKPYAGLFQSTNGKLYGTTSGGGIFGYCCGTVFSVDMGLGPFVSFVRNPAKVGQSFGILGNGLKGTTAVLLNGTAASFTVRSDTLLVAKVPAGATSGYVSITTSRGVLKSNIPFYVMP